MKERADPKPLRTADERLVSAEIAALFERSPDSVEIKLENFPKYVRRQHLTGFLSRYEIFKKVLGVKGSVIECGVHRGFGLMTWAKLSAVLEPVNLTRRIYGFDTFEGFPSVNEIDRAGVGVAEVGGLAADSLSELQELVALNDRDRFLGHIDKVHLVAGDATQTIPEFMAQHKHLVVSLLFLDFDLYEPTLVALREFVPRMPRGAVI